MPIATFQLITTPREARDVLVNRIRDFNDYLGFGYIGKDDEQRLPHYPAVVVSAGGKEKEFHGTHTFNVRLTCTIWVYHANLAVGHATRSDEDLVLTEKLEEVIERDLTFDRRFISSYIDSVQAGLAQPRNSKSSIVIGSRLLWVALSQQRFK